jgi:hypothetical protein
MGDPFIAFIAGYSEDSFTKIRLDVNHACGA